MRIAVTGKHGQVARALTEVGRSLGADVVPIGRPDLDLCEPETVGPALTAIAPELVVNAAAYTLVDQADRDPKRAYAVNATGAGAVASAAAVLGIPVIQLSTDYVFDGNKNTPYTEDDPTAPLSIYGASKLAGERLVAAAAPDHVILRTAWVYSAVGTNFVRTMLALAKNKHEIRVVSDQRGCPTYAVDIARAIVTIAGRLLSRADPDLRGVFHLAGSEEGTWAEFAAAIFAVISENGMGKPHLIPITSAEYPTVARRPINSRLDCTKLARVYGIQLPPWRTSLSACLARLIEGAQ